MGFGTWFNVIISSKLVNEGKMDKEDVIRQSFTFVGFVFSLPLNFLGRNGDL